jgi:hypothetical protein
VENCEHRIAHRITHSTTSYQLPHHSMQHARRARAGGRHIQWPEHHGWNTPVKVGAGAVRCGAVRAYSRQFTAPEGREGVRAPTLHPGCNEQRVRGVGGGPAAVGWPGVLRSRRRVSAAGKGAGGAGRGAGARGAATLRRLLGCIPVACQGCTMSIMLLHESD